MYRHPGYLAIGTYYIEVFFPSSLEYKYNCLDSEIFKAISPTILEI